MTQADRRDADLELRGSASGRLSRSCSHTKELGSSAVRRPDAGSLVRSLPGGMRMEGIGSQLRQARQRLGFSLRDVEDQTARLAQQVGVPSYRMSASWLDRIERENRGLSGAKLIILAGVYGMTNEQILALYPGVSETPPPFDPLPSPNSTLLIEDGILAQHARLRLPDNLVTASPPEHTALLASDQEPLPANFKRGIIGRRDRTMEPLLLAGAIVLIDTQQRAIAGWKDWDTDYDRPIYFLLARDGYFCGFCELDRKQDWLLLVPHPLSPASRDKRWRYRREVEVLGTVDWLCTRRAGRQSHRANNR